MLIEAEALHKSFASVAAVRGISLKVERGERVGVLGPNGAGKSTTLRMLAGTLAADSGLARIAGADVASEPDVARARLGYLPEAAHGFSTLTVAEFLMPSGAVIEGLQGRESVRGIEIGHLIQEEITGYGQPAGFPARHASQRSRA